MVLYTFCPPTSRQPVGFLCTLANSRLCIHRAGPVSREREGETEFSLLSPVSSLPGCVAFSSPPHVWKLFRSDAAFALGKDGGLLPVTESPAIVFFGGFLLVGEGRFVSLHVFDVG